ACKGKEIADGNVLKPDSHYSASHGPVSVRSRSDQMIVEGKLMQVYTLDVPVKVRSRSDHSQNLEHSRDKSF
ncbi:hypothetical protein WDU94_012689, partial [Cyamophila willieti]